MAANAEQQRRAQAARRMVLALYRADDEAEYQRRLADAYRQYDAQLDRTEGR